MSQTDAVDYQDLTAEYRLNRLLFLSGQVTRRRGVADHLAGPDDLQPRRARPSRVLRAPGACIDDRAHAVRHGSSPRPWPSWPWRRCSACPAPAAAQSFGKNKVQYRTFDWKVVSSPHFEIYYYPGGDSLALRVLDLAEKANVKLTRDMGHALSKQGADHPLRLAQRLRADERHDRVPRRGHRRLHRAAQEPRRAAVHRLVRGPAARRRARADARLHVRHAVRRAGCRRSSRAQSFF